MTDEQLSKAKELEKQIEFHERRLALIKRPDERRLEIDSDRIRGGINLSKILGEDFCKTIIDLAILRQTEKLEALKQEFENL